MFDKKIFIHSLDSTISIIEGIYDNQKNRLTIHSKKNYLKSIFFEKRSEIIDLLFAACQSYRSLELKTNLQADSQIYKLFLEQSLTIPNLSIQRVLPLDRSALIGIYRYIIDSNFQGIQFKDNILEKRILSEIDRKAFDEIKDVSFLYLIKYCMPKTVTIFPESIRDRWNRQQAQQRNRYEPVFGGALTTGALRNIFD